jgi:type IV pilus assembly protein PilC
MPTFFFKGERADGTEVKGKREADGKIALISMLQAEGIRIAEMKEVQKMSLANFTFLKSIKTEEKIVMTRTLSAMLKAGLALSRALSVLEKQSTNPLLKKTLTAVGEDVKKGSSLNEALAKHPKVFNTLYVSMVKAGEESGTLYESLMVVTLQMERSHTLMTKVRSAMIYPSVIFVAMIIIGILMLVFVVPTLTNTFTELGVELPPTTQAIITVSNFLKDQAILSVALLVLLVGGFAYALRTKWGNEAFSAAILHAPIVAPIVKETYTARTARTLASLLGAGVEVLRAIEITKEVVGHPGYARVLAAVHETVRKGDPIAKVFIENSKLYPVLMSDMIAVGEETGGVAQMLVNVAEFYEAEVEQKTKDLSTVIEPVLMLFIGGAVGVFALSMIAPIYSITENI